MKNRVQRWRLTSAVLVLASVGCAATAAQDRANLVPAQGAQAAQPRTTPAKMREPSARERIAMEAAFARADTNNDGKLSRAEAAHLPAIEARFDELDTNHDGFLSIDEFIAGAMDA
ncbi:MAG TPA: EF-hand domain-containing protein [Burkholderiaceae bacterium]|nr:EF-hand domain-containing protein [Burkholderiaceae bacterium]